MKTLTEAFASRQHAEILECLACAKAQAVSLSEASAHESPAETHAQSLFKAIERIQQTLGECS